MADALTVEEARKVAHVSRRTIYNWIAAGKLRTVRTAGGGLRILEDSIFRPDTGRPERHQPDVTAVA